MPEGIDRAGVPTANHDQISPGKIGQGVVQKLSLSICK